MRKKKIVEDKYKDLSKYKKKKKDSKSFGING